jgi:hypothetical protein
MTIRMTRLNRWLGIALGAAAVAFMLFLGNAGTSVSQAATPCPPAPPEPRITGAAMQRYEHGYMVWLKDSQSFFVMYGDQFSGTFEVYPDTWKEGMPETDPNLIPPPGLFQPTRGGGYLWRNNQKVREGLGWGIEPPTGFTTLIQTQGNKTWFNGQGYDVFEMTDKNWRSVDVWRK